MVVLNPFHLCLFFLNRIVPLTASIFLFSCSAFLQSVSFSHPIFLAIFFRGLTVYLFVLSISGPFASPASMTGASQLFWQSAKCCKLNGNNNGLGLDSLGLQLDCERPQSWLLSSSAALQRREHRALEALPSWFRWLCCTFHFTVLVLHSGFGGFCFHRLPGHPLEEEIEGRIKNFFGTRT